jgi:PAS domain S-box-containing protein
MGLFFRKRRGEGSATPNPSALPTAPAPVSSPPTTSPTAQPAAPAADASLADAIIDSIDDGLMVVDANGTIKIFNPKAAEISGFSANEALNLNFISIFKLADAAENAVLNENNPIMNTIKNRTPLKSDDFMLTQKSGTRINLELRISLINFGGATGAAVLFRDITARNAAAVPLIPKTASEAPMRERKCMSHFLRALMMLMSFALSLCAAIGTFPCLYKVTRPSVHPPLWWQALRSWTRRRGPVIPWLNGAVKTTGKNSVALSLT